MATRRTLIEGLNDTPPIDPKREADYVYSKPGQSAPTPPPAKTVRTAASIPRVPISTRLRADLAEALTRASLQRKLDKIEPNSLAAILEAAIEPWLNENGYPT